jgi:DNA-binding beta-propeller fold protein YncE
LPRTEGGKDKDDEDEARLPAKTRVIGLIPTGWYPNAVGVNKDGHSLFIVNGKSNTGSNPKSCRDNTSSASDAVFSCQAANQYVWQLSKAGLLTLPMPKPAELAKLTLQVAANNNFSNAESEHNKEAMEFLRNHIKHVVYIVKENRTYDQVFGDLKAGNGDPALTLFPQPLTPNHHKLASGFVTLDHFLDSGETSNTGWNWTTSARATDYTEKEAPVNYAERGLQYDQEGNNRNINVGLKTLAERRAANPAVPDDPDILPGTNDVAAPDPTASSGGGAGAGYIWDAALKAGLTIRNYGFYGDLSRYFAKDDTLIPLARDAYAENLQVFYPAKASLLSQSDIYFRGFDMAFPDFYRVKEWSREFAEQVKNKSMPNLTLLRLPHDHFGQFAAAVDGINTPELQMADNDYAVGKVVETIAASPFAKDTMIFILEDDAQDGADHVDAHRSLSLIIGPYVKKGALISKPYTTVNVLRTMEEILKLPPLGLNDGLAEPMADVFDRTQTKWSYAAEIPGILHQSKLPLEQASMQKTQIDGDCFTAPRHPAAYWQEAMAGQNFNEEDRLDTASFNKALWSGLKGNETVHPARFNADLRRNRQALLATWKSQACQPQY